MDGARRQDSLGVSSSVAEGVLTPAALHLRVSAEVEREGEVGGKRAKMSQTSFQAADRKPSSNCHANPYFHSHQILPDRGAPCTLSMGTLINYCL
ncbi:hypothetical protein KUCAC02_009901 [Chaenocephalus aceratus]|uniref:Uncharacterized protein n=1 Tax=Chaenocephalus aceratus TaxID=36190 RepID=A0ACB9VYB6_CHAAC|nr:hypothetical protein KUCAC02_009901 [Chaenocephalus aceratus]